MSSTVQILLQNHLDSGLGKISAAASLQWSRGTPGRRMRRLGCYALVYVVGGGGRYRDERGHRRNVEPGNLIVLVPDIAHAYGPAREQRWDEIYVLFEGSVFDLWREQGLLMEHDPVLRLNPIPFWRARLERVWAHPRTDPLESVCRLQTFLSEICREQTSGGREAPAWLVTARAYLADHLADPVDLPRLARDLGMSYESFRKCFRKQQGVSPGLFRRRKVMDEAARLLLAEDLPLKQVAEATGFCDEFYFSRQFKGMMGVSPGAYRRRFSQV